MNSSSRYGLALGLASIILVSIFVANRARALTPAEAVAAQEARRAPVEVTVVARKYSFSPARIEVQQDDIVKITLRTEDIPHSFTIDKPYRISKRAAPGQPVTFEFRADQAGEFTYYCELTTDQRCSEMRGKLVVNANR